MDWRPHVPGVQLALRASVAAGISVALAQALNLQHPIYAFLAAVIATDLMPAQSRMLGVRRIYATIIGGICGAAISQTFPPGPWTVALGVLVAMAVSLALQAKDGAKVAGYVCGIVVLDFSSEPWHYALYRVVETVLGVLVAWGVSYVPKLIKTDPGDGKAA
jgi:uncharacterized membrane protein YccC